MGLLFAGEQGQRATQLHPKEQNSKPMLLTKFKGIPIVVYFHPTGETPRCTKQAVPIR